MTYLYLVSAKTIDGKAAHEMSTKNQRPQSSGPALASLAGGLGLLILNATGIFAPAQVVVERPGVPGYSHATQPTATFERFMALPRRPTVDWLTEANRQVSMTLAHAAPQKFAPSENWILWLGSMIYEPLGHTQDPDRILSRQAAVCSEAATVLMYVVKQAGLRSRFVGLTGHTVLEVEVDGKWYVLDPDLGCFYGTSLDVLTTPDGLTRIRECLASQGYPKPTIDDVVKIFSTTANNTRMAPGVIYSPRLHVVESVAEALKWLVPFALLAFGISRLWRVSPNSDRAAQQ